VTRQWKSLSVERYSCRLIALPLHGAQRAAQLQGIHAGTPETLSESLYKTTDGGQHWSLLFTNPVFHSTDRGINWTVVNSPILSGAPSRGIFSVVFKDERNGILVGGDYKEPQGSEKNVAYTRDGGATWDLATMNPAGYGSAVAFIPGSMPLFWVTVGTNGSDYSVDSGKTWLPLDSGDYNAVSFSGDHIGPHTGWAVGAGGTIARFNPQGRR